jgi:hypothetical protein
MYTEEEYKWRHGLKKGDLVDACDGAGTWRAATVIEEEKVINGSYCVTIGFRIYSTTYYE